jgi:hypothetical protein
MGVYGAETRRTGEPSGLIAFSTVTDIHCQTVWRLNSPIASKTPVERC